MGDSEPSAADEDFPVGCFRAAGAEVVPGRREDCGTGAFPALFHCVLLGSRLLRSQPPGWISDGKAGDCRIAIRRVCVGDDELRGGAALGDSSLAPKDGSGLDHYWADPAYGPGRAADCAGGEPVGAKVEI